MSESPRPSLRDLRQKRHSATKSAEIHGICTAASANESNKMMNSGSRRTSAFDSPESPRITTACSNKGSNEMMTLGISRIPGSKFDQYLSASGGCNLATIVEKYEPNCERRTVASASNSKDKDENVSPSKHMATVAGSSKFSEKDGHLSPRRQLLTSTSAPNFENKDGNSTPRSQMVSGQGRTCTSARPSRSKTTDAADGKEPLSPKSARSRKTRDAADCQEPLSPRSRKTRDAGDGEEPLSPRSRKTRGAADGEDGCIQVCIRCRPLIIKEEQQGNKFIWAFRPSRLVELDDDGCKPTLKVWAYDNVFGPDVDTKTLFKSQCKPIVQGVLDGYNGTIFAYGQTSSGKTYTLMGNPRSNPGVVILSLDEIFNSIAANNHVAFDIYASYIEMYKDNLTDLLQRDPRYGRNLEIIEDKNFGAIVKDLQELPVLNRQHCLDLFLDAEKRRRYASTSMNETSSRSHTVFRLRIEARTVRVEDRQKCCDSMTNVASELLPMQNSLMADHASLYLVDRTTNELLIQAGETTLRLPMSQGIAGAVATTGETINIPDAYLDSRFNTSMDKKMGYRTKSILCMPIRGSGGQIVGVVQFTNKMQPGSLGFDANDELLVEGLTQRLGPLISSAQGCATMTTVSQLNLVDLAGSERVSKSEATGDVVKQVCHINQSLLTLGSCIAILSEGKQRHVPFRDSKLTHMLSTSLGGNAKACLICVVSPASCNRSETLSTLQFASQAKKIINHVRRNCQRDQTELVEAYEAEIARLRAQLQMRSSEEEAIYMLQSNQMLPEAGIALAEESTPRLQKFKANVCEAQRLANQSVIANGGTCIFLSPRVACERGNSVDSELVVRVSCTTDRGRDVAQSGRILSSGAKWISEEELLLRLEWLQKQDAAGTLTSLTTNGSDAWNYAGAAVEAQLLGSVPQVKLDCFRRQSVAGISLRESAS